MRAVIRIRGLVPAALALLLILLSAGGCSRGRMEHSAPLVTSLPTADVVGLDADNTVRLMRRAGFTDGEILQIGPHLRNALAQQGGARVRVGDKIEAIFAVDGTRLHVTSRRTGSFIHELPPARP
jgi:hypothetical protein